MIMGCVCTNEDRKDFPPEPSSNKPKGQSPNPNPTPRTHPNFLVQKLTVPLSSVYKTVETITEEHHYRVFVAKSISTGKMCRIKTFKLGAEEVAKRHRKEAMREANLRAKLDHPHICKLHEVLEDDSSINLVSEHCGADTLRTNISAQMSFSEQQAATIMQQVFGLVGYCHSQGVMLRSLSIDSLYFAAPPSECQIDVKLTDITNACEIVPVKDRIPLSQVTEFFAPELLTPSYTEFCDLWSCGVVLFYLISGESPYLRDPSDNLTEHIKQGKVHFSSRRWQGRSTELKRLLERLLSVSSETRPLALECRNDPWIERFAAAETGPNRQISDVISQLRSHKATFEWKQDVLTFVILRVLDSSQLSAISHSFDLLDTNKDGFISQDDLRFSFRSTMSAEEAQTEVERIMTLVDRNKNGLIDYSEFLISAFSIESVLSHENLLKVFNSFDRDQDGRVSLEDLKSAFSRTQCEAVKSDIEVLVHKRNKSIKSINFEDFVAIMQV